MTLTGLNGRQLTDLHDDFLATARAEGSSPARGEGEGLWHWIERNHLCNSMLWDEEDQARRTDMPDAEIVRCKRSIDRWNQQRNDAVEQIDTCLLEALKIGEPAPGVRLHSETPGAMIDRLSILSLKIHHMRREATREDAQAAHRQACTAKLERLLVQRQDLRYCLDRLLGELARGESCFRLYRQFKMYNDPTLNPWLYRKTASTGKAATTGVEATA